MKCVQLICFVILLAGCSAQSSSSRSAEDGAATVASTTEGLSSQQIFEKRIMPIFQSPNPSSCVQCHLAGVDLKNYILPSHEKTFQSLRDQGLIDLEQPEKSKILRLIQMGDEDRSGSALINHKVRRAEYEAFAEWIKRSVADARLRDLPKLENFETAQPKRPAEVIRHARTDRLLASFENTIWAMRFRCMGCHTEGTNENKKNVEKYGERVAWMKATGPVATLDYLRTSKLIDIQNPEKSLLLRKPLNEVKHGGGKKFLIGDQGYKAFRTFLEDYARIVRDQYSDAKALPKTDDATEKFGTDLWIKLANTPPAWADHLLQINVYAWDAGSNTWESAPIATTDRAVWGKGRLWQHNLTLLARRDSERAAGWKSGKPSLPSGKYLVRVYVEQGNRLEADWKAVIGASDYVGQAEVVSRWPEGYGRMTVVEASSVRR